MSADRRILPCGDRALLVELDTLADALALYTALAANPRRGVVDLVPAARTVLLRLDPRELPLESARTWLANTPLDAEAVRPAASEPFDIDVVYDGPDLAEVAEMLGITPAEVIARHSNAEWSVAFGGFAPGFAYIVPVGGPHGSGSADAPSVDAGLFVPRRSTPRTLVPAGAVGLAGEFSGVYPRASPGGWQLIGTSPTLLWDSDAPQPAPLTPGRRVRFRPIAGSAIERSPDHGLAASQPPRHRGDTAAHAVGTAAASVGASGATLTVQQPGPLSLLQDLGRPGHGAIGVGTSGALDRAASALANRLLGNDLAAATIEVAVGGLTARFDAPVWFAVTGADGRVTLDESLIELDAATSAAAGAVLHIPIADAGLRYYLAVRGGLLAPQLLDSRSRDTLASLGPTPLAGGDTLPIGAEPPRPIPGVPMNPAWPPTLEVVTIRLVPGPRADWLETASLARLYEQQWSLSSQSNRVGARLEGEPLLRARGDELPSEGMVAGAIQLPPNGLPTVLLADHPVTGGYPVIAVVADVDLDRFAQLRPGQRVQFRHAR